MARLATIKTPRAGMSVTKTTTPTPTTTRVHTARRRPLSKREELYYRCYGINWDEVITDYNDKYSHAVSNNHAGIEEGNDNGQTNYDEI